MGFFTRIIFGMILSLYSIVVWLVIHGEAVGVGWSPILNKSPVTFGFREVEEAAPWRDAFPDLTGDRLPGVVLRGVRNREGLTQVELSRMTGIPQRHISEIENG
jgi:hypothetical protein